MAKRIQSIQQKVPIGSQVTFTLKTDEKVSGILTEIALEHITLEVGNCQKTIFEEAILMFDVQDQENEVEATNSTDANTEITDSVSGQVEASESVDANIEPVKSVSGQVEVPNTTDTNTETTDSVPGQVEASNSTDANTETTDAVNFEEQVSEQLDEIEKRFKNEIEDVKIELEPPDFTFPADELKDWQNTSIAGKWLQIKNKYENAQRINELNTKFGRIQPLLSELTPLVRSFPNSPSLKRVFAYFNALSHPDDWQKTIQIYQEVAITSDGSNDWFNVAVSALNLNNEALVCFSLEKFFRDVSVIDAPNAWYIYVRLIEKFNNLSAFRELCKKDENDVTENEVEVLLDAAIYLFKKKVTTELAIEIVQRRIKDGTTESLLREVCEKLGGQSIASYRQFLSEFMESMIALEKKPDPITRERSEHIETAKQSISRKVPRKQTLKTKSELNEKTRYKLAKQADQDGNLEFAENLYRECLEQDIRYDSVIKDLAMVLVRLGRPEEAVDLLEKNRPKVKNKQALDNVLLTVYLAAAQYKKAIDLLNNALEQAQDQERRLQIRMQIASAYIKLEDYVNAENELHQVLKLWTNNITVQRNLAFCLSKQNRYNEAKQILKKNQSTPSDAKTRELLEAIERAQSTGEFILDDDRIISGELRELSEFAEFFLASCTFEAIQPDRLNEEGKYIGSETDVRFDIGRLDKIAREQGTRRPRARSNTYLTAARIYYDRKDNRNIFYRYLCRSFASRGDAAVSENSHLDTARDWYCEALRVYGGIQGQNYDEQDAVNALARFLFSYLGREKIPMSPYRADENAPIIEQQLQFIGNTVETVISNHPQEDKVFDAIVYLLHCQYAETRILKCFYDNLKLRETALDYLQKKDINIPESIGMLDDFVSLWRQLRAANFNESHIISTDLRLLNNFEITTAWLEDSIRRTEDIRSNLFFELDQQRVGELQKILESAFELCKQVTFEERDRWCFQLCSSCQVLLGEIKESPTRVSVEDVYPIIEVIQERVDLYRNELYKTSKPQLILRLPVESYVPIGRKIQVQLVVENEVGRSPAESLELVIEEDEAFFEVTEPTIKRDESLRGGEKSFLKVPLRVTPEALKSRTFSLSLCAQYRTRTEEQVQTPVQNFSIRLYSKDEFEKIKNPYAAYAEGGVVDNKDMFVGREELIQNIAQAIQESRTQSKSVIVFGQKRSGKSSVLYHLKKSLEKDQELLILDLGNMSTLLDQHAQISLLHQFLKGILRGLDRAIRQKEREGLISLDLAIPGKEFYDHPAPLQLFEDTFVRLKDLTDNQIGQEDWRGIRVVLLIDEFQYIYDPIIEGKIPDSFMQNWKALLQANYFSAVLVGQDVMPKFKLLFPNEFGTTQDERVTYLKEEDARKLIDEPIRIGGRQGESRYREQAIERILDITAGSPFYIQIICNRLVEYMNVKHAVLVTEADVETVKNELIHGVNALGLDKFDNLINSGDTSADAISDEDALKVLKIIADNSSKTDLCHRDRIDCKTRLPVDTILDDLVNRDVVKRRDQSYQIQVGLFKEWLVVNG